MILIKDRHPCKWNSNDDFLGIGKYDTYKGSTLIHIVSWFTAISRENMILIKDRHMAIARLIAKSSLGKYDTYKGLLYLTEY